MELIDISVPEMLPLREASRKTGISYDRLRKMCLQKEVPNIRSGNKFLINFTKLCAMLNGEESFCS